MVAATARLHADEDPTGKTRELQREEIHIVRKARGLPDDWHHMSHEFSWMKIYLEIGYRPKQTRHERVAHVHRCSIDDKCLMSRFELIPGRRTPHCSTSAVPPPPIYQKCAQPPLRAHAAVRLLAHHARTAATRSARDGRLCRALHRPFLLGIKNSFHDALHSLSPVTSPRVASTNYTSRYSKITQPPPRHHLRRALSPPHARHPAHRPPANSRPPRPLRKSDSAVPRALQHTWIQRLRFVEMFNLQLSTAPSCTSPPRASPRRTRKPAPRCTCRWP